MEYRQNSYVYTEKIHDSWDISVISTLVLRVKGVILVICKGKFSLHVLIKGLITW